MKVLILRYVMLPVMIFVCALTANAQVDKRPNIVLIVGDDIGFSDTR